MPKSNYDTTIARMAGNIVAGLVNTPHFQHRDGVVNHQELVAVAVDLARRIVAVCREELVTPSPAEEK